MSVPNRFAVGLGLIDAIAGLDAKSVKLQSRVGIVTGLVVVSDLIGEGSAREQSIVDETPDLSVSLRFVSSAMSLGGGRLSASEPILSAVSSIFAGPLPAAQVQPIPIIPVGHSS
jgi:hypothetical protein